MAIIETLCNNRKFFNFPSPLNLFTVLALQS
uniref:Uncharacterized protein n=1 Tax=Arundo donax TaxID=35708 RepID=A0A0A9FC26_ARUDO